MVKNTRDFRPESYRPNNFQDIKVVDRIEADGGAWVERRKFVLKNVFTNLEKLIKAAKNKDICTSLAVFKPKKILDFTFEETDREWNSKKLLFLESKKLQLSLFDTEEENDIENFEIVDKVPFKFFFKFEDDVGKVSKLMTEDWEIGMLFLNSLKQHEGNEKLACESVRKKYFEDFAKTKDYYFFLGTTQRHHYVSLNPFVIIGDFRPKFLEQGLFEE